MNKVKQEWWEIDYVKIALENDRTTEVSYALFNYHCVDQPADMRQQTTAIGRDLRQRGFTYLGRVRFEGRLGRYWSQYPSQFYVKGKVSSKLVIQYLIKRRAHLEMVRGL